MPSPKKASRRKRDSSSPLLEPPSRKDTPVFVGSSLVFPGPSSSPSLAKKSKADSRRTKDLLREDFGNPAVFKEFFGDERCVRCVLADLPCFCRIEGKRIRCECCTLGVSSFYQDHVAKKQARAAAALNPNSAKVAASDPMLAMAWSKLATAAGRIDTAKQFVSGPAKVIFSKLWKDIAEANMVLYKLDGGESEVEKEVGDHEEM